jgi:Ion channel
LVRGTPTVPQRSDGGFIHVFSYVSWSFVFRLGYGDLTPHTQETRFLAIIFIPFACAVTGQCLAWFAKWIIEKQGAKYRKSTFESHNELTPEDLRVMDITGGTFCDATGGGRLVCSNLSNFHFLVRWKGGMV